MVGNNRKNTIILLSNIFNIGFGYISLFVIIAFTYYYIENYNDNCKNRNKINHIPILILNIAVFISANYPFNQNIDGIASLVYLKYFGANGVFGGIIFSYISIKIYI